MARRNRTSDDSPPKMTEDDRIVEEAHKRHEYAEAYEAEARKLYVDDVKFANGDSENHWQWPDSIYSSRDSDNRPCLTVNMVRQHNLNIINDAKQNKSAIKISPVSDGASFKSAQIYEGIIRHIEYQSNAAAAYDRATQTQVEGGIGYWRVMTDYIDSDSFDQEIYIRPIRDPLTVLIDPDAQQADRSDARYAFVYEDVPRGVFKSTYPEWEAEGEPGGAGAFGSAEWANRDHVRVGEYFRVTEKRDRLLVFTNPEGERETVRASKLGPAITKELLSDPTTKVRDVLDNKVEWFKIVGRSVVDRREWPGIYIPIVMVVGEESWVQSRYDRKGHTRSMKDSQRIYNYMNSASAEFIALQTKSPWAVDLESIEGYEAYWEKANTDDYAYMPYRSVAADGRTLGKPEKMEPPGAAQGYLSAMQYSRDQLQAVSGQFEAQLGQPGNERTGIAIQQRQRQGDRATYHYVDNLSVGIRFTGKLLIDLIPKVYDTERVVRILAENGDEQHVAITPDAKEAHVAADTPAAKKMAQDMGLKQVDAIFNPSIGKYAVQADAGPGWATKRQETYNAVSQIAQTSPDLMKVVGDILFKAADFPMADEIAERLKRLVPPAALGEGPTPQEQALQGELQKANTEMQAAQSHAQAETQLREAMETRLQKVDLALKGKAERRDIEGYRAESDRMDILMGALNSDPEGLRQVVRQLMADVMQNPLTPLVAANSDALDTESDAVPGNFPDPQPGATSAAPQQAPALPSADAMQPPAQPGAPQ